MESVLEIEAKGSSNGQETANGFPFFHLCSHTLLCRSSYSGSEVGSFVSGLAVVECGGLVGWMLWACCFHAVQTMCVLGFEKKKKPTKRQN